MRIILINEHESVYGGLLDNVERPCIEKISICECGLDFVDFFLFLFQTLVFVLCGLVLLPCIVFAFAQRGIGMNLSLDFQR